MRLAPFIVVACSLLQACGIVLDDSQNLLVRQNEDKFAPELGQVTWCDVGCQLFADLRRESTTTYEATLAGPAHAWMGSHTLTLDAGRHGPLSSHPRHADWKTLCFDAITQPTVGVTSAACLLDTDGDNAFEEAMFPNLRMYFDLDQPAPYTIATHTEYAFGAGTYQRVLTYEGLSERTIRLAYRESVGGLSHVAFKQDLTYALAPDGTADIEFNGARLRVLEANELGIRYIVDSGFTPR
jgi:hypothetical protein